MGWERQTSALQLLYHCKQEDPIKVEVMIKGFLDLISVLQLLPSCFVSILKLKQRSDVPNPSRIDSVLWRRKANSLVVIKVTVKTC